MPLLLDASFLIITLLLRQGLAHSIRPLNLALARRFALQYITYMTCAPPCKILRHYMSNVKIQAWSFLGHWRQATPREVGLFACPSCQPFLSVIFLSVMSQGEVSCARLCSVGGHTAGIVTCVYERWTLHRLPSKATIKLHQDVRCTTRWHASPKSHCCVCELSLDEA